MKKKRWRKIVLSFLPILIVVIGLVFISGVLMPGQRELPENVSDALQLDAGTETVWPRLSEFSIVEDEQLDEVRDRLNDALTYADPAGSPLYRFAVKPGEAFRVYSASAIEDPFTLQFSSSEQPIEIDDAGNGTFPEEEGTYALRMMKNYDDAVILTYEAQVVVSADEQERDRINIERYIQDIRDIDPYNFANAEGYAVNRPLISQYEPIVLSMGDNGVRACLAALSDGSEELLSDYVLFRWIAMLSGIGNDLDRWDLPSDYRDQYLQEVANAYEVDLADL